MSITTKSNDSIAQEEKLKGIPFAEVADLRDHFATEALGLCFAKYLNFAEIEGFAEGWRDGVAMDAYKMADAMIAARSR